MNGKAILEEVFEVTFPREEYVSRVLALDAQGAVGKRQLLLILIKVCEALDRVDADLQKQKDLLEAPKPKEVYETPTHPLGRNADKAV